MKRAFAAIVMITLLLTTALAEEAVLSAHVDAERVAVAAMKEKYGLTNDVLGLFTAYVTLTESGATVRYLPAAYLPAPIVGEYEVQIRAGQVTVSWTHDDQDPLFWQSDMLDSPCWGAKQLNQVRLSSAMLAGFLPADHVPEELPDKYGDLNFEWVEPTAEDLPAESAMALADAAIKAVYNLPAEEIRLLDHTLEPALLLTSDGQRLWRFSFGDPERCFDVMVNAATGEIFAVAIITGGIG